MENICNKVVNKVNVLGLNLFSFITNKIRNSDVCKKIASGIFEIDDVKRKEFVFVYLALFGIILAVVFVLFNMDNSKLFPKSEPFTALMIVIYCLVAGSLVLYFIYIQLGWFESKSKTFFTFLMDTFLIINLVISVFSLFGLIYFALNSESRETFGPYLGVLLGLNYRIGMFFGLFPVCILVESIINWIKPLFEVIKPIFDSVKPKRCVTRAMIAFLVMILFLILIQMILSQQFMNCLLILAGCLMLILVAFIFNL